MPISVIRHRQVWDVVVSRRASNTLFPVWLVRYDREKKKEWKVLLCQVQKGRFGWSGWTVVVAGAVNGIRLVEGFKSRQMAIRYAISIRQDLQNGGTP